MDEMMDGGDTEADVRVLIPDRITVLLDHDVSHRQRGHTGQSARRERVLERRTCRQRDHAWVRWGLDKCQSMPQRFGVRSNIGRRRGAGLVTLLGPLLSFAFSLDFFWHV